MNIVVVLRAVQDPAGMSVNRRAQKVFVNREAYRLNPADHNALEAALAVAGDEHSVTVVAYGGAPAEDVLRDALAAGATRAVWLKAPGLQFADAATVTRALRCTIAYAGGAGLVALGAEVVDADLAQVAPRLAVALGGTFVGDALHIELVERAVRVVVANGGGYRRLEAEAPAVVAVARDSNEPRYAPAPRIITVYSTPEAVEVVTLEEIGVGELMPLTEARGESFPPERERGGVMEGTEDETAARVGEMVRTWAKVGGWRLPGGFG